MPLIWPADRAERRRRRRTSPRRPAPPTAAIGADDGVDNDGQDDGHRRIAKSLVLRRLHQLRQPEVHEIEAVEAQDAEHAQDRQDGENSGQPRGGPGVDDHLQRLDAVLRAAEAGRQLVDDQSGDENADQAQDVKEHRADDDADQAAMDADPQDADRPQPADDLGDRRDRRQDAGIAGEQAWNRGRFDLDLVPFGRRRHQYALNAGDQRRRANWRRIGYSHAINSPRFPCGEHIDVIGPRNAPISQPSVKRRTATRCRLTPPLR